MHDQFSSQDIITAINNAPQEAVDLVDIIESDSFLTQLLVTKISTSDAHQIIEEVKLVALGLTRRSDLIDNILVRTDGDEFTIEAIVLNLDAEVLGSISTFIDSYPINKDTKRAELPKRDVGLMSVLKDDDTTENLSRDSLLDQIETPDQTVKKPDFAYPKSKPSVVDVLKKVAEAPLPAPSANDDLSIKIVDPFKALKVAQVANTHVKTEVEAQPTPVAAPKTQSPATEIQNNLDKKLTDVTGTATKESFKVSDPYKEPIS